MQTIDAHITLTGDGAWISAAITEANYEALTALQQVAAALIAQVLASTPAGIDSGRADSADQTDPTDQTDQTDPGDEDTDPLPAAARTLPPPAEPPANQSADAAAPRPSQYAETAPTSPQRSAERGKPWPHPKTGRALPKGIHRGSARARLLELLAEGPVSGTYEEIASDIDTSYGALRQVLTKLTAADAVTRERNGRTVTIRLRNNTAVPMAAAGAND